MSALFSHTSRVLRLPIRRLLLQPSCLRSVVILHSASHPRCFHDGGRRLAGKVVNGTLDVTDEVFWKQFKKTYDVPTPSFDFPKPAPLSLVGTEVTGVGFLKKIATLSDTLCFAQVIGGANSEHIQIISQDTSVANEIRSIRLNSPISFTGIVSRKHLSKKQKARQLSTDPSNVLLDELEIKASHITSLNDFPSDIHVTETHIYSPKDRHLQIRFDEELKRRLQFRSEVAAFVREEMKDFQEIETPVLFKSTPEGAREFLVPTRKPGYAYALPQSPQQYKQILMASGIHRYIQFAKCFRDEDLRADRQPEFTQIDLEMSFANGEMVMNRVEKLMKSIYAKFAQPGSPIASPLPDEPFVRVSYEEAMSLHGSDKPDLRIKGLIHRVDQIVPIALSGMLTSITNPIIEACKFRFNCTPKKLQEFVTNFMRTPEAEPFNLNQDGAPGFCIYDSRRPVEGLQTFGFEAAEELKKLYKIRTRAIYEDEETYKLDTEFEDGDLLFFQARDNKPHTGGSTVLGKLRLALHKAAVAEGLIEADPAHRFLWVINFPMFTLDNDVDPGQGGAAGFSATHHPFTAPKTAEDVDMLLHDPLKARADHYDIVLNGVELGGGSRRIHNAEMQQFIMRNILKMSEERMNDFSHLFEALRAGCPPHAGLAIGFDRLMAIMTGRESVKDVIAFPKSSKGEDLMIRSPSKMRDQELRTYGLMMLDSENARLDSPTLPGKSDPLATGTPSQA